MAFDLFLGPTEKNIARGSEPTLPMSDEVTITFTDEEKAMLEKISIMRMKADSGDNDAKKELIDFTKKVAKLKVKAKKGDPKAKRILLVLNESGIFNPTQQLTILGFSLFSNKDDEHSKQRRREEFEAEVTKLSTPAQITDFARIVAFNPPLQKIVQDMATRGSSNAINVMAASKTFNSDQPTASRGVADIGWTSQQYASRRTRRAARISALKTRANSGDQQAITILRRMRQRLSTKAASGDQTAVTRLQQFDSGMPTSVTSQTSTTDDYSTYNNQSSLYPNRNYSRRRYSRRNYVNQNYPSSNYTNQNYGTSDTSTYDQDTSYDSSSTTTDDSQPTIDSYQGDSLGAEEAQALAQDGGATERSALHRTSRCHSSSVVGNAIPHENYRVAVMKAAVKSAGGGKPTTKDFFQAKSAVDKVIGKTGITIYMPGAKPGRCTI